MQYTIEEYISLDGKNHFRRWLEKQSTVVKAQIQSRLYRVELGNLGDSKSVGDGVFELRIHLSPGYRVYFGIEKTEIVVLLVGGDKSSQRTDISKAKSLWIENKERKVYGKKNS